MPRNQKSKSNTSAQLSVRCDAELKEQYQNALDEEGKTMSGDLRDHMQKVVERNGGQTDNQLPQKPKARKGLKVLVDHAYQWGDGWIVDIDDVKGEIKNEANISGRVDRQVFKPLKEGDYIRLVSTAGKFEIDPDAVAKLRDDVAPENPNDATAEDSCALCGDRIEASNLTTTSEDHPEGPNLIACPNCANPSEARA